MPSFSGSMTSPSLSTMQAWSSRGAGDVHIADEGMAEEQPGESDDADSLALVASEIGSESETTEESEGAEQTEMEMASTPAESDDAD